MVICFLSLLRGLLRRTGVLPRKYNGKFSKKRSIWLQTVSPCISDVLVLANDIGNVLNFTQFTAKFNAHVPSILHVVN